MSVRMQRANNGHWRLSWGACALLLLLLLCAQAQAAVRTLVALDGPWRFQRADVAGAEAPGFDDGAWTQVTLPHTWNAVDGEAGGAYHRGAAWYRLALDRPADSGERRSFLEFDGAALAADVWVNGRHAGRHEGGYARFRFDITSMLQPGRNVLAVRVDNSALPTVAPLGGDFTVFGGLYRGVRLVETSAAHFDLLDHGGPGVDVVPTDVSAAGARLQVKARLRNDTASARQLALRLTLRDAAGRVVARAQQARQVPAASTEVAALPLKVTRPHLWQGVHDPYLYRLTAEVLQGEAVVDELSLPVGIRRFAVDPQRGFLLNGRPYPLHGVNYFHPGRPGKGLAVADAEIDEDLQMLQALGVTGLRLVHFQHPPRVYERADELGFVLWTEIPLNAALHEGDAFRANLAQQMRELIRQNRHHPSVAVWGVGNEVYRSDEATRALLAEMHALARQEDAQRLTAYAHCCAADDHAMALQTNLTGYNRYYGWYDGETSHIGPWADALHLRLPDRALGLSEYGAGASVLQQQDPPARPVPNSRWHPEQYQALFHEAYWPQIEARPWLWSSFVWVGFDLASAGRNEGDKAGINDKGLVTYDRKTRKDAWFWYQANWSQRPMVHIANRRATPRSDATADVKVYSNTQRVRLHVNGVALPEQPVRGRMAVWQQVALRDGRNTLRVTSDRGVADEIEWVVERSIKLDQLGFLPGAAKWAVVPSGAATRFKVVNADTGAEVFEGPLSAAASWEPALETVKLADFSAFKAPGRYRLRVERVADSDAFTIAGDVYAALNAASLKAFYFNRAGIELPPQLAGPWARPAGHVDVPALVHASAAGPGRPEGTRVASPKGWYDAGDYNQYVVNSGISTYTLLAAYEHFPQFFSAQKLGIPESGNGLPDVLDEALWNLEWLLTMQDPADGGVYHKLTNKNFDGLVMPHQSKAPRYLVRKSTAAALDFAAVMAHASRVFSAFEAQRPGLSARMLAAAKAAWQWAKTHPVEPYREPSDVHTGTYGDDKLDDEFAWAAAELYISTRDDAYYTAMQPQRTTNSVPSWGDVKGLAWMSLAQHREHLTPTADRALIEQRIKGLAQQLAATWQASPYRVSMQTADFVWGSNAVALNQALVLIQGYRLSGERNQLDAAQAALDYVLGRNPLGLSMVTGIGARSPLRPHHRPSEADGVAVPVPGFIVGGPNPGLQDRADCPLPYASAVTAKAYLDHDCSYASNEVAINWNAPLVYVSAALQVLTQGVKP